MKNKLSILFSAALFIYVAMSPLLWLPGIVDSQMRNVKVVVFNISFIAFLIYIISTKRGIIPPNFVVFNLVSLLLFIPFFFISGDIEGSVGYFFNFVFSALAVLIGINYKKTLLESYVGYKFVFLFVSVMCFFPIVNFFTGLPDWSIWLPVSKYMQSDFNFNPFWSAGFNGNRTGWSESIGVFIPFAGLFIVQNKKLPVLRLFIFCLPIFVAQVISNGRNGLMSSVLAFLITIIVRLGFSVFFRIFSVVLCLFLMFALPFIEDILVALRIYDLSGNVSDNITSYRTIMYNAFFDIYLDSPFIGKGFLGSQNALYPKYITDEGLEMHNGILRIFIDHGLLFGLLMLYLLWYSIHLSISMLRLKVSALHTALSVIILQGVLISLFQPRSLFGGFQISAIWWVSLGILISENSSNKYKAHYQLKNISNWLHKPSKIVAN